MVHINDIPTMDVTKVAQRHGGISDRVVTKAKEFIRLYSIKQSSAELALPAVCLLLAGKHFAEHCDRKKLAKCVGCSAQAVDLLANTVARILGIHQSLNLTINSLCVKFGCSSLVEQVEMVYQQFCVRLFLGLFPCPSSPLTEQTDCRRPQHQCKTIAVGLSSMLLPSVAVLSVPR